MADPHRYELRTYDEAAILRLLVRVAEPLPTVRVRSLAPRKSGEPPGRGGEQGNPRESAVTQPAFGVVLADPRGRMWVQSYSARSEWTVFNASGLLQGRIHVGSRTPDSRPSMLAGVEADYIVVRERDEDGAVHLAFYRVLFPD